MKVRILTVSDLHQVKNLFAALRDAVEWHKPDVVGFVGDVLHAEGFDAGTMLTVTECAHAICSLPAEHLVFVRGNHEGDNWQDFVGEWPSLNRHFHALYGSAFTIGPLVIVGFPCAVGWEDPWRESLPKSGSQLPCEWWQVGRKRLVQKARKWLDPIYHEFGPAAGTLWLMHEPPTDQVISNPVSGNRDWERLVRRFQPKLTVSGHFHQISAEGPCAVRIGSTTCANVGQTLLELRYTIIDLEFSGTATPELPVKLDVRAFPRGNSITEENTAM